MADAMQTLQEVEYLGEEILSDKRNIINLDQQRHKNREALRHVLIDKLYLNIVVLQHSVIFFLISGHLVNKRTKNCGFHTRTCSSKSKTNKPSR